MKNERHFFVFGKLLSVNCLIIVGMMGAGKTTIGRELAKRQGVPFIDTDHALIERTGVAIATIFEIEGEEGFRRREAQIIDEITASVGSIVATGGGAVLNEDTRRLFRQRGTVIYLDVPPDILWERTQKDKNRPLLQIEDPKRKIAELYEQRDPLYRAVADIIVEGGRSSPHTVVRQIEKKLAALSEKT